ncbi:MAG: DUF4249 domain-containing protein [Bacteroidota bacterium]
MRKLIAFVFLCAGCLDPYFPPASTGNINALVIDGFIDANGTASVRLVRSIPLDGKDAPPKESGATITIESSNGDTFFLHEDSVGLYLANNLAVDKTSAYTLHIVTSDEADYRSEAMKIYSTPTIDSIYWKISESEQLEIRADSHNTDPNSTGYYILNSIETYEYHAAVFCHFKLVNHMAVERLPEEEVFVCYRSVQTPGVIGTTKGLRENRLSGARVTSIKRTSEKIAVRYSILVKQRTISEEEFTYQRLLQAYTEQQGSLFAQIPGTIASNIHSTTNPDEYVLGYFRAQEVTERRFSIDTYHNALPPDFYQRVVQTGCTPEATCDYPGVNPRPEGGCVPSSAVGPSAGIVTAIVGSPGFVFVESGCGDCTQKGGTTIRPPYW